MFAFILYYIIFYFILKCVCLQVSIDSRGFRPSGNWRYRGFWTTQVMLATELRFSGRTSLSCFYLSSSSVITLTKRWQTWAHKKSYFSCRKNRCFSSFRITSALRFLTGCCFICSHLPRTVRRQVLFDWFRFDGSGNSLCDLCTLSKILWFFKTRFFFLI